MLGLELSVVSPGYKPRYPVLFVPGAISTGLELWQGKDCAKRYFRQRIKCWIEHLMLDPVTGTGILDLGENH
ncbi:hypothetical protein Pelo_8454 [Pelomyxa schiedti]|nr:hypothetical protein Pelo_8454 [Pelomyxa schiedti]